MQKRSPIGEMVLSTAHARATFTLVKNSLRNVPFEIFHRHDDRGHIIHLANNRNEIWNELNGADDVENCTRRNHLRMPRYFGMRKRSAEDPKLLEKAFN